jgi:hypothetical protein
MSFFDWLRKCVLKVSSFHLERWKRERAADVSQSTVNRELNIIRGCFSRAVEWDRLGLSPMRRVKPYRVDDVRLRVCTSAEIKRCSSACQMSRNPRASRGRVP